MNNTTRATTYNYRAMQRTDDATRLMEIDGKGMGLVAAMAIGADVAVLTMRKPIVFATIKAARKFLCDSHRPLRDLFKQCVMDNEPEVFNDLHVQVGTGATACWVVDDDFDFSQVHPYPRWYYLNSSAHGIPMQQALMSWECNVKVKAITHCFFGKTVDFITTRDLDLGEELQWCCETGIGGDLAAAQLEDMRELKIVD